MYIRVPAVISVLVFACAYIILFLISANLLTSLSFSVNNLVSAVKDITLLSNIFMCSDDHGLFLRPSVLKNDFFCYKYKGVPNQ